MEHSFRAAVFDLDGTLLDTLQDLGACADEALRQYGFPGHTMEEYRSYIGNGIPRLIARAVPEGTSEQDIQKVLNFYLGYYPVHCAEHTRFFPGVAETIRLLRQRELRFCLRRNAGGILSRRRRHGHGVCQPDGFFCRGRDLGLPPGTGAAGSGCRPAVFVHAGNSAVPSVTQKTELKGADNHARTSKAHRDQLCSGGLHPRLGAAAADSDHPVDHVQIRHLRGHGTAL